MTPCFEKYFPHHHVAAAGALLRTGPAIKNSRHSLHDAKASPGKDENVILRVAMYVWPQKTQEHTE
jgi:hypothetical protein